MKPKLANRCIKSIAKLIGLVLILWYEGPASGEVVVDQFKIQYACSFRYGNITREMVATQAIIGNWVIMVPLSKDVDISPDDLFSLLFKARNAFMTQREVDHLLVMFTCHSPNIVELVLNHFKKSMGPNELLVDRKTVERKLEELYMTNDTYAQLSGNVWMVLVGS